MVNYLARAVSSQEPDLGKAVVSDFSDCNCLYMYYLPVHYPEPDNHRLITLLGQNFSKRERFVVLFGKFQFPVVIFCKL